MTRELSIVPPEFLFDCIGVPPPFFLKLGRRWDETSQAPLQIQGGRHRVARGPSCSPITEPIGLAFRLAFRREQIPEVESLSVLEWAPSFQDCGLQVFSSSCGQS